MLYEKKKKIYIIVIVLLSILLVVVSLLFILEKIRGPEIKYKNYQSDMIQVKGIDDVETMASVVDDTVVLLLSSDLDNASEVIAVSTFNNNQGEQIASDEQNGVISGKGKLLLIFNIPNISEDDYAGTIDIQLSAEDAGYDGIADTSKITIEETHEIDEETNNVVVSAVGTNGNDYGIFGVITDIVAIKDGKIVDYNSFYTDSVAPGGTFDSTFQFAASVSSGQLVPLEFDELDIFVSYADMAE